MSVRSDRWRRGCGYVRECVIEKRDLWGDVAKFPRLLAHAGSQTKGPGGRASQESGRGGCWVWVCQSPAEESRPPPHPPPCNCAWEGAPPSPHPSIHTHAYAWPSVFPSPPPATPPRPPFHLLSEGEWGRKLSLLSMAFTGRL